ncbi:hypothetical protein D3C87_1536460 [compost metagenome]
MVGERVPAGENRRVQGDVRQVDRAVAEQRMLRGYHEIQRIVPDRRGLDQSVGLRRQGNDRQFGAAMEDFLVGHFRIEKLNVQCHFGIAPGELP